MRVPAWPPALAGLLVGLAIAATGAAAPEQAAEELLPDLDQRAPHGLVVTSVWREGGTRFRLGFDSVVDNVGLGPLVIRGSRSTVDEPVMVAHQAVRLSNGLVRTYPDVGLLRYVESKDHSHWHFLPFARYELRRAVDFGLVVRDRKTGFCLGDRFETDPDADLPGEPPQGVFVSRCGLNATALLHLRQGTSVGYSDNYLANLEGQYLDITGLEEGWYFLVHRVNPAGKLRESDYENNAAALLVRLSWPEGMSQAPRVKVLAVCEASEYCEPSAARYARAP